MHSAILVEKITKINETEALILRYLVRVLRNGPKRIDYACTSRALDMTYTCLSKAIDRLIEKGLIVGCKGELSLGSAVVSV